MDLTRMSSPAYRYRPIWVGQPSSPHLTSCAVTILPPVPKPGMMLGRFVNQTLKASEDRREAMTKRSWCPGEDSNLHGFHHWYLKPARLPIPPPGLSGR